MKRIDSCLAVLLFLPSFVFFHHPLSSSFLGLDDQIQILDNPLIQKLSWPHLYAMLGQFHFGQYWPITLFSYAADYSVWGPNVYGFRLTNLILHALNSMLLYGLFRRMAIKIFPAFFAALIFACHPVQIEPLIWISARKYVLASLFLLGTFMCHLK